MYRPGCRAPGPGWPPPAHAYVPLRSGRRKTPAKKAWRSYENRYRLVRLAVLSNVKGYGELMSGDEGNGGERNGKRRGNESAKQRLSVRPSRILCKPPCCFCPVTACRLPRIRDGLSPRIRDLFASRATIFRQRFPWKFSGKFVALFCRNNYSFVKPRKA